MFPSEKEQPRNHKRHSRSCAQTAILQKVMPSSRKNELRQESVIIFSVVLIIAAVLGVFAYRGFQQNQETDTKVPESAPLSMAFGDESIKDKVVVYTDPVCDKCAAYHEETVKPLYEEYVKNDKIQLEIRPLSIVTEQSAPLVELLMCSNEQGKFWQTSDFMYEALERNNNRTIQVNAAAFFNDFSASRIAVGSGLDENKLSSCLRDNRYDERIKRADTQAYAANIYSTPTTFVGTEDPVRGYAIYEYVKSLVDISI